MPALPASARRVALEVLSRDRLAEITTQYDLHVDDRRAVASHIDAVIRARSLDFGELLRSLKRDELKAICSALELDDSGREKDLLVQRILGEEASDGGKGDAGGFFLTPPEPKPRRARENAGGARGRNGGNGEPVGDYRHDARRKNNPPAGLIDFDRAPKQARRTYSYDPHLDPQLQWAGKAEHTSFEVDTVSLHIHERVSAQAIMRAVKREDAQRSLFGEDELPESQAIDFYAHDVNWANRLVLGDSLVVMNSLLEREQMAAKVQCVFIDPPYGVNYRSNFQPAISRRDFKEDDSGLTREPEQIQAYRDTWTLGIHSYLAYLRDRLLLARDLLAETGSIFVQISDTNIHHARELMDEIFSPDNFVSIISFAKTSGLAAADRLATACDYLLWYARDRDKMTFRQLFMPREPSGNGAGPYAQLELEDGTRRPLSADERAGRSPVPAGARRYRIGDLTKPGPGSRYAFEFEGRTFDPGKRWWGTTPEGLSRLARGKRLEARGNGLWYVRYWDDFSWTPLNNLWEDTATGGFVEEKRYAVQTNSKVVSRCMLMTTNPGDLVLDPTCGSGTTAFVAEAWGRRWITCDTSRVALAIARQRLLTARYPFYSLRSDRVRDGFVYKTVPHVTLKSIAQNPKLDTCTSPDERERVIRECADQEVLYDQPEEDRSKVRVTGPFTVEAIPVASMEDPGTSPIPGPAGELRDRDGEGYRAAPADPAGDHTAQMIDLLRRTSGVDFKGKRLPLPTLRPMRTAHEWIHAESETGVEGDARIIAVSFGPRCPAARNGWHD